MCGESTESSSSDSDTDEDFSPDGAPVRSPPVESDTEDDARPPPNDDTDDDLPLPPPVVKEEPVPPEEQCFDGVEFTGPPAADAAEAKIKAAIAERAAEEDTGPEAEAGSATGAPARCAGVTK
jgi:hypothetical protein